MRRENSVAKKALVWCLVLQVIIFQGSSVDMAFTLMMKNEMYGLKRPAVVYRCKSGEKSLRWHQSSPDLEFSWDFGVPLYGTAVVIHRCKFLSSQGTADVEIKTLSMTTMLCGGNLCKYAIRPDGIYFVGYEIYYPHVLLKFLEFVRPVDKLVEPWKAWSPRQLEALRAQHNSTRPDDDKENDDDDKKDDD
ncbi:unnamed protein product [Microthlaspi erraticum]|uniref:Uncharacterized protein n=1 Tax=Microthlaspi erraticum TaxID=1685480 RepID=A0A6D2HMJ1_9BRAS|nr:unnamed protein product [Microthlaspi erraticum]CAA7047488.1 unnamed protein product [Microthlaspi erraticum]